MPIPPDQTPPEAEAVPALDRAYRGGVVLGLLGALAVFIAGVEHRRAVPYVDIEMLLDNSPSMEVGATPGDVAALMYLTPCSEAGAVFHRGFGGFGAFGGMSASGQMYAAYSCGGHGATYNATSPACPVQAARGVVDTPVMRPGMMQGPRCANLAEPAKAGMPVLFASAGAPCAFACHWDTRHPAGAGNDYFGVARSTIGRRPCYEFGASPADCTITLRFDLVKGAVRQALETMRDDNEDGVGKFAAGIFTFDSDLHPVYPVMRDCGGNAGGCEAGDDFSAAIGRVGAPPGQPGMADDGIQASTNPNGGATNTPKVLRKLAEQYLTQAGDGRSSDSPLKALFIVSDGLDDYIDDRSRRYGAMDPGLCDIFKSMGYRVFVVYTPYIPQMNGFYLFNIAKIVEKAGPGSVGGNLRACASDPALDFIETDPADPASIPNALQLFVERATHT